MSDHDSTVEYRIIKDFPDYRVGTDGSVWSRWAHHVLTDKWRLLRGHVTIYGYRTVGLVKNGKVRQFFVHRLVLEAFVGPKKGGQQCRHVDGNRLNNHLKNILWGTPKENADDRQSHGRTMRGERSPHAKLTDVEVAAIRCENAAGKPQSQIVRERRMSRSQISKVIARTAWKHVS